MQSYEIVSITPVAEKEPNLFYAMWIHGKERKIGASYVVAKDELDAFIRLQHKLEDRPELIHGEVLSGDERFKKRYRTIAERERFWVGNQKK